MAVNTTVCNPVGKLNEIASKKREAPPSFEMKDSSGEPHNKVFIVEGKFRGFGSSGQGMSIKEAKRDAAVKLLECVITDKLEAVDGEEPMTAKNTQNSVGELLEKITKGGFPDLEWEEVDVTGPDHLRKFTMKCKVGFLETFAENTKKKEAKRTAAALMLQKLGNLDLIDEEKLIKKKLRTKNGKQVCDTVKNGKQACEVDQNGKQAGEVDKNGKQDCEADKNGKQDCETDKNGNQECETDKNGNQDCEADKNGKEDGETAKNGKHDCEAAIAEPNKADLPRDA